MVRLVRDDGVVVPACSLDASLRALIELCWRADTTQGVLFLREPLYDLDARALSTLTAVAEHGQWFVSRAADHHRRTHAWPSA